MGTEQLPAKIETLVDHLRKNRDENFSLADVASVTEVLIGTMQTYFRSVDTSIYRECRMLSEYIGNARKEIAALQPQGLESDRLPRAGMELDAIVQHTEEATNTIMESAETIMAADPSDVDTFQQTVQDNIMQIFEACSFQDITGQRISKVVETLTHVEDRIYELRSLLGITDDEISDASGADQSEDDDGGLLSGPALAGEGIDQDAVDALMGEQRKTSDAGNDEAAERKVEEKPQKKKISKPATKKSASKAEVQKSASGNKKPDTSKEGSKKDASNGSSSQDEIDALFN